MRRGVPTLLLLLATSAPAIAEPPADGAGDGGAELEMRWPTVGPDLRPSFEQQLTDRLTELGNAFGRDLDRLSHDVIVLQVDGRGRRAHLRIGGGSGRSLAMRIDSNIQFDDLDARMHTRIDLALHGHWVSVELPDFDVAYTDYRGDHGVEVRLPLFERTF